MVAVGLAVDDMVFASVSVDCDAASVEECGDVFDSAIGGVAAEVDSPAGSESVSLGLFGCVETGDN